LRALMNQNLDVPGLGIERTLQELNAMLTDNEITFAQQIKSALVNKGVQLNTMSADSGGTESNDTQFNMWLTTELQSADQMPLMLNVDDPVWQTGWLSEISSNDVVGSNASERAIREIMDARPTFDYEAFSVDDWTAFFRMSTNFDQAYALVQQQARDQLTMLGADQMNPPIEGEYPTESRILEYARFDLNLSDWQDKIRNPELYIQQYEDEISDKAQFLSSLSIYQLRNLPYFLDDNGQKELINNLHMAGYFDGVGTPMAGDVADTRFQPAWLQALRDIGASGAGTGLTQFFDDRIANRLIEFDESMRQSRGTFNVSINDTARTMLNRDLNDEEVARIYQLITTFTDEERADIMSGESNILSDLPTRAMAGIQQDTQLAEEVQTQSRGEAMSSLLSLSWDDFFRSSNTLGQDPTVGIEL